ncbi:hypothetical protein HDU98_003011 [Podochytrium sp. JEL0797]|nr:hypothetical protein HDU98_003011 [Podochytrium sp. JEL0797]
MDFAFSDPPVDAPAVTYDMALQKLALFYDISDVADSLNEVASVSKQKMRSCTGVSLSEPDDIALDAVPILAQKGGAPTTPLIKDLFTRAGFDNLYSVQNGILLCKGCHANFDALRRYVDVADGHRVAKVVNVTNDPRNWEYVNAIGRIEDVRSGMLRRDAAAFAGRTVMDTNNELTVYFADSDTNKHPNLTALAFHKAACLIWKMSGAADDIEVDDMDNDGSVDCLLAKVADRLRSLGTEYKSSSVSLGEVEDV